MLFIPCNLRRMSTVSKVLEKPRLFYANRSLLVRCKSGESDENLLAVL